MDDFLAALRAEHERIDAMVGSLRRYVARRLAGEVDAAAGPSFVRFFRDYAGHFHHAREEEILLAALVRSADLPGDRGPVAVIAAEHRELSALLDALAPLLCAQVLAPADRAALHELAQRFSHGMWHHIDAETSVLLPEARDRLRRAGARELPAPPAGPGAPALCALAAELILHHPPLPDPELIRGDGCVHCPSYGVRCDGVEREWWSDHEWEDLHERARHSD